MDKAIKSLKKEIGSLYMEKKGGSYAPYLFTGINKLYGRL